MWWRWRWGRMRNDTVARGVINPSLLSVTVSEAQIWTRNAAVGEHPIFGGHGETVWFIYFFYLLCDHFDRRAFQIVLTEILPVYVEMKYWYRFLMFPFPQLLYTGIVIYAPALILNQGNWCLALGCHNWFCVILYKYFYKLILKEIRWQ